MKSLNDLRNPHILLIYVLSLIPTILIHVFYPSLIFAHSLVWAIVASTLPIFITVWILWYLYTKTKHYKEQKRIKVYEF